MKLYVYEYCDEHKSFKSATLRIIDTDGKAVVETIVEDLCDDVVRFDGYRDAGRGLFALLEVLGISSPLATDEVAFTEEMVRRLNTGLENAMLREVDTGVLL